MMIYTNNTSINPFRNSPVNSASHTQENALSSSFQNNRPVALDRRFDTFINEVSNNFIGSLNKRIEQNLMKVVSLSAEDRRYMAYMYKENMKRLTKEAIEHEERELEKFRDLKKEKSYYRSILDENGYIDKGKYAFSGVKQKQVSKAEVQELLNEVQSKIDDIVTAKVAKESDPLDTKTFEYLFSGAMFLAATDMKCSSASVVDDSSISGQWSRTEENFEAESRRTTDSLNKRLEDIDKMHTAFLKDKEFDERIADETLGDKQEKINALLGLFKNWTEKTIKLLLESGNIDEQAFMKSFEKIGI